MDTFERNAARLLAVAYNAYLEASLGHKDDATIRRWARCLLGAQRDTGVELIPVDRLLYPLTGEEFSLRIWPCSNALRDGADTPSADDVARNILAGRKPSGSYTPAPRRADDEEGGALIPAPKPQPRKPSPGASVAAQAAKFYANRA